MKKIFRIYVEVTYTDKGLFTNSDLITCRNFAEAEQETFQLYMLPNVERIEIKTITLLSNAN